MKYVVTDSSSNFTFSLSGAARFIEMMKIQAFYYIPKALADEDEDAAGSYSLGIDGTSQGLRQENVDGDDEADNEDDYVEALYE